MARGHQLANHDLCNMYAVGIRRYEAECLGRTLEYPGGRACIPLQGCQIIRTCISYLHWTLQEYEADLVAEVGN